MSMIGKTLGNFEITSQLGKGGMGEVYQAKDRKLGRDVAIKVLPEEFARDADRVARFQREAKLLASLNHPNIAAIYGLEESSGTNFLVLELVEGDTLADRIKGGPIPVEESLKLALQIAEALEAAHEKGVIHRDLKPANIKVTPDGKVKVLDFGLAKAFAGEQAELNLSNSPTLTRSPTLSDMATQQGVILGTAAYMSPEQAKGKTVDKRADIWAFGVVLFEMLTGRQLFTGETVSETLAAVLMREPDFSTLPPKMHQRIRLLLERCLEKEPKNRYHDIADVRVDIQKAIADPSGVLVQPVTTIEPQRKLRTILPWAAATLVLGLIIAGVAVWKLKPLEPKRAIRFEHALPEGQQLSDLAVSPDGQRLVYGTSKGLYVRSVDELTAKLIAGTEESTRQPFFSPDGNWIGYFSVTDFGKLKKIPLNGGEPVVLCSDLTTPSGISWNEDSTIAFGRASGDIMRVSANGGTPETIIKVKSGNLLNPQFLPDEKSMLYSSASINGQPKIMVMSLKSGETKELFPGLDARYLPTGHIIYRLPSNNNLFAIPFDLYRLEATGVPVSIVQGVKQYAISESGTLVYIPGASGGTADLKTLVWVNLKGKEEPLLAPPDNYGSFRISPDGKRVALTISSAHSNIWILDSVRETRTRLTFDESNDNSFPLWTPDGNRIVYWGSNGLYWKAADGTGEAEILVSLPGRALLPWSWSKDGKTLVLFEIDFAPLHNDIGMLSMEGDHARKPLLHEKYFQNRPRISPDGKWIAYGSYESGKGEVKVRPFPELKTGNWQVSTNGGDTPLWSPDGRELFYHNGDAVIAVPVETEPTFKPGKPTILFRGPYSHNLPDWSTWDISPDGKRFLMLKSADENTHKIVVVLNWFEELKQRVPTGK